MITLLTLADMVSVPPPPRVTLPSITSFVVLPSEFIEIVPALARLLPEPEMVRTVALFIVRASPLLIVRLFAEPLTFKVTVDATGLPLSIKTALLAVGIPVDHSAALFQFPTPPSQISLVMVVWTTLGAGVCEPAEDGNGSIRLGSNHSAGCT